MALRSCKRLFHSPCARRVAIGLSLAVVLTVFAAAQNTNGESSASSPILRERQFLAPR